MERAGSAPRVVPALQRRTAAAVGTRCRLRVERTSIRVGDGTEHPEDSAAAAARLPLDRRATRYGAAAAHAPPTPRAHPALCRDPALGVARPFRHRRTDAGRPAQRAVAG